MGFFDLNVPYETSSSSKDIREKIVRKAMELGYTGIAFNRTIKGVMSDRDRCSITPFSLNTLLNNPPSLAYNVFSINFHRDLLNIPRSSPFRQYTRLTVCVESLPQCQALNGGNPILKSYDLIAVRPLNQSVFDIACEKSEVHIISIDFSKKLPFRLKLPMVKAAMERGVYFEIAYSDLVGSVEVRTQMISNAKLLVDWTRGRNLILSSAAPSVYEVRGPYDVANLSSLIGLSTERAKAALSKNCRTLITNALKKKHFYKEAIRVEQISSDKKSDSKDPLSMAWLKWDPMSSGEGDLQLEDIEKSFAATTKAPNTIKAIDFGEIINSSPFHVGKSLTSAKAVEVPANMAVEEPFAATGVSEKLDGHSPAKIWAFDCATSQELHVLTNDSQTSTNSEDVRIQTDTTEEVPKILYHSNGLLLPTLSSKHDFQSQKHITRCELNAVLPNEGLMCQSSEETAITTTCATDNTVEIFSKNWDFRSHHVENSTSSQGLEILGSQNVLMGKNISESGVRDQDGTSLTDNFCGREKLRESAADTINCADHPPFLLASDNMKVEDEETMKEIAMEEQEHGDAVLETYKEVAMEDQQDGGANLEISEAVAIEEQVHGNANLETSEAVVIEEQEQGHDLKTSQQVPMEERGHVDENIESVIGEDKDFKVIDKLSDAKFMPLEEAGMKEQKHERSDSESSSAALVPSLSEKSSAMLRAPRQPLLFPLRRILNPLSFKRKSKKKGHKRKV